MLNKIHDDDLNHKKKLYKRKLDFILALRYPKEERRYTSFLIRTNYMQKKRRNYVF